MKMVGRVEEWNGHPLQIRDKVDLTKTQTPGTHHFHK